MKRPLNSSSMYPLSGSTTSFSTKSTSQRVPMIEMSGAVPPAMSVVRRCCRLAQATSSMTMSISGLAASNSSAIASKIGAVWSL